MIAACGPDEFDHFFNLQKTDNCGVKNPLNLLTITPLTLDCSKISAATKLYVAETFDGAATGNSRITSFDITTITDGENAENVLGQGDFTSNGQTTSQARVNDPSNLPSSRVGQYLFVPDPTHNRVMVWDVLDITNGENAANVLGQANFTSSGAATTSTGMSAPSGLDTGGDYKLFVADQSNNRVLVYDVETIANGQAAENVLGQTNFTSSAANTTSSTLSAPVSVAYDPDHNHLFVSETGNDRILVFNVSAISNGQAAINVLGQTNFTSGQANRGGTAGQGTLNNPVGMAYAASRLYVADSSNNRILIYNVAEIGNGEDAEFVLGQPDFTTTSTATTAAKMNNPQGVSIDEGGSKLFVADTTNNRVLVYDLGSISNGENAVNVLGQTSFTANTGALTRSGMESPQGLAVR